MNVFAKAWLEAANDLKINVVHPFSFLSEDNNLVTTVGVYLPDFGSSKGTLLTCRFDSDSICDIADLSDYYSSGLNPSYYEPYDRDVYIETLNDWGWFSTTQSTGMVSKEMMAQMTRVCCFLQPNPSSSGLAKPAP